MTENEAIEIIKYASAFNSDNSPLTKALEIAIQALEEIQRYQATGLSPEQIEIMKGHDEALLRDLEDYLLIGSVEECREAVEKMKPKKPIIQTRGVYDDDTGNWIQDEEWFMCPTCRKRNEVYQFWKSCHYCNQRLLWE